MELSDLQWAPVREDSCVHLEYHPWVDAPVLVNTLTNEKVGMLDGPWELAFDEGDGSGFLYKPDDADAEPVLVSERFERVAFRAVDGNGGVHTAVRFEKDSNPRHMDSWLAERDLLAYTINSGGVGDFTFSTAVLTWPRDGFNFFWSLSDLYTILRLKVFGCRSYVWLNHQWVCLTHHFPL